MDSDVTTTCQSPSPGSPDPPERTSGAGIDKWIPEPSPASRPLQPSTAPAANKDRQCLSTFPRMHALLAPLSAHACISGSVNSDNSGGCRPHRYIPRYTMIPKSPHCSGAFPQRSLPPFQVKGARNLVVVLAMFPPQGGPAKWHTRHTLLPNLQDF